MLPLLAVLFTLLAFWFDWRRTGLNAFDYLVLRASLIYTRLMHRVWHNRPAPFYLDRGCIVVCNHTCSPDPMFLLATCRYPIGFVVAQEHFKLHPFCHWVLRNIGSVPVRRGGSDPVAVRRIIRTLQSGRTLCVFPEGGLSGVARNRFGPPKHGAAYLALKTRAPLFPVFIHKGPRTDSLLAAWLRPPPVAPRVYFGKPIDLSDYFDRPLTRKVIDEVTRLIMKSIADLNPDMNPDRGTT
jgi:1-acyl-sn-glycerol-3-phosphate acyltransferase